jgi:predicted hydrolase (HD superfamily)
MDGVFNLEKAKKILQKYNKEPFHIRHGEIVSGVMGYYSKQYDPGNVEFWQIVGMIHDIDFELYPEEHCVKGIEILRQEGADENIIRSALSHGYGITETPFEPESKMEKILFAVDELTGLIGAVAIMRPSKSVMDLELPSVKKKFKDKKFAAGCSRETIQKGADYLGWHLDQLISETILAMRCLEA